MFELNSVFDEPKNDGTKIRFFPETGKELKKIFFNYWFFRRKTFHSTKISGNCLPWWRKSLPLFSEKKSITIELQA